MVGLLITLSLSIDALGIGISYGLRKIKTPLPAMVVIGAVSLVITLAAFLCGDLVVMFIPSSLVKWVGAGALFLLGTFIVFSNLLKKPESFDKDESKHIDVKESLFLGIALSIDSFGTGICSAFIGVNSLTIPFFVAVFQILFLSLGIFMGKRLQKLRGIPQSTFVVISGIILMLIAAVRLMY